jgi:Rha family phage regulatory protein
MSTLKTLSTGNTGNTDVSTKPNKIDMSFIEPRQPGEKVLITSNALADLMDTEHHNIMKIIANSKMSNDFKRVNFERVDIIEKSKGGSTINRSHYKMTRDGFFLVSMGLHSQKAVQIKELIIARFNALEQYYHKREGYTRNAYNKLHAMTVHSMIDAGYTKGQIRKEIAPTLKERDEDTVDMLKRVFGVE